jgi:hypothetical protein
MWQQQDMWRQNKERLDRLEAQKAEGMQIGDGLLASARRQVEMDNRNATAIADAEKQKQATAAAIQQQVADRQAQQGQVAQEAYKRLARTQWPGDQASFDAAWPRLLQDWQVRQTAESAAALAAPLPGIRL